MKNYFGTGIGEGYAIGRIFKYGKEEFEIKYRCIEENEVEEQIRKFESVLESAGRELEDLFHSLESENPEEAKIFRAHREIVFDVAISSQVKSMITKENCNAKYAMKNVFDLFISMLEKSENELTRERASDLKDVYNRIMRIWFGKSADHSLKNLDSEYIIVAHDLFPSDTATMDFKNVLGVITEIGGITSHTAILAKNFDIPAVLGVPDIYHQLEHDDLVILDAKSGMVIFDPDEEKLSEYKSLIAEQSLLKKEEEKYLVLDGKTKDGSKIDICMNIGSDDEIELKNSDFSDGVGLFRTEFLYMRNEKLPDESVQFKTYKNILQRFKEKEVIIRTMDIGGDKQLSSMELPKEQNPFLGLRALRLCFDMLPVFKTQLRALLRASVYGNLAIMFPMVGSIGDIRFAKRIVEEVKQELILEKIDFDPCVKVGIMIEIPSIAIMADIAASEVDFASIGTNDLCQYLTAVDRLNPAVAKYYQSFHPAMFRIINHVVKSFVDQKKPISVCGEMGGDPLGVIPLLGLGIRKFSMSPSSMANVKKKLLETPLSKAQRIANTVLHLSSGDQVEAFLKHELS